MEQKQILRLEEIAGGALQEKFQAALAEVLDNMQDPNTPWKVKREVSIKIGFSQGEDRCDAVCEITVSKKLAQSKPIETMFYIGKDLRDSSVFMQEYGHQVRGHMSMSDFMDEADGREEPDEGTGNVRPFAQREA